MRNKTRFFNKARLAVAGSVFLFTTLAVAQNNNASLYSFGSACVSQGEWTRRSAEQLNEISGITERLKSDGNCTGVGKRLQAVIQNAQRHLPVGNGSVLTERMSQIPQELAAFRTYYEKAKDLQPELGDLIVNRSVEGAKLAAKAISTNSGFTSAAMNVRQTAELGLDVVDALVDQLPSIDSCIIGKEPILAQLFTAGFGLAADAVSSGNGYSSKVAQVLSKFTNAFTRDRKYSGILQKMDETRLDQSMSCLIETTTDAYCNANDTLNLFNTINNSFADKYLTKTLGDIRKSKAQKNLDDQAKSGNAVMDKNSAVDNVVVKTQTGFRIQSPFQGYYMLINQVPAITAWLQKIKIGNAPQLESDANFQNQTIAEMANFYERVKTLQGKMNRSKQTMKTRPTVAAKRNDLIELLKILTDILTDRNGGTNFFIVAKTDMQIPFFLTGMDDDNIPQEVSGIQSTPGQFVQRLSWSDYMVNGGKYRRNFDNPDDLVEKIAENLGFLIESAQDQATAYNNKWFLADKVAIVSSSLTNLRYDVPRSFRDINFYLTALLLRVKKLGGDTVVISTITDTQTRINHILLAFAEIRKLDSLRAPLSDEEMKTVATAYENLLAVVSQAFFVAQGGPGILANRMADLVTIDYKLMVNNGTDFTPAQQDFLFASGTSITSQLAQMYMGGATDVVTDISTALTNYGTSIEALELLFKDKLLYRTSLMKMRANNKMATTQDIRIDSILRAWKDSVESRALPPKMTTSTAEDGTITERFQRVFNKRSENAIDHPVLNLIANLLGPASPYIMAATRLTFNLDRYPIIFPGQINMSAANENGAEERVYANFCIQSLAFNDWAAFGSVCNGVRLKSTFKGVMNRVDTDLTIAYNKKAYEEKDDSKLSEKISANDQLKYNRTARVCAFRDWKRRNTVLTLTLSLRESEAESGNH